MSSSTPSSIGGAGDTPWQTASAIVGRPLPVSGSHVLTIDGYSGTKDLANGKGITSETFAVGRHRWYIRYFPDGYSSGDVGWISIYLHLVPTDDADEVNARYEISLLGHDGEQVPSYGTESQTCRTFSSNTGPWGCPQLITRKDLEESVYLKDDVLSIRCEVTMPREIFTEHGEPPPSDMRRHFGRLLSGGEGADVEFKVGGETFSAHRCVLAARSSVFRALLLGPTKMNHGACIRISGMEARVFKAMLQFIYTDSLPDMEEDDVVLMTQHLIVAAKKYNLERLKLVCAEKLCNYMDMDFLTDPTSGGASSTVLLAMSSSSLSSVGGAGGSQWQTASAIVARPLPVSGSHILKIDGYSRTKNLVTGKGIKSETFVVGRHRWYIRYFPDGHSPGQAGWISIYLYLVDTAGVDEVNARCKISLLDQDGEPVTSHGLDSHTCFTFSSQSGPWGCAQLITRKDLEESVYLKDDGFSVKCVLAARSSVFMAELFGPMKETTDACVTISDMEAEVFMAMLYFIYTDSLPPIDDAEVVSMAQHLLVAADRYNLERLKLLCVEKLCKHMDASTAATSLALAEQHSCRGLKAICFKFLASPGNILKAVVANDGFEHVRSSCPSVLKELVSKLAP
ncbi:BTB/POZ and MATH domain-containing protein 1-like [Lolium rigidum]|uniref:BTB/POZ and MATH domain-containing protein 1-like n=1 Tax=Lolium rigidum TaxID=89674 RepID=UPI001F5D3D72|nr:BTB/POZ and MATH domain-containing protein 1-like [Lolium rigidum]